MYIKHYSDIDPKIWDNFVFQMCEGGGGHSFYSYDLTALPPPRIPTPKYENLSFGIFDETGELVLIFQLFIHHKKRPLKDILRRRKPSISISSFHGMCIKNELTSKQRAKLKQCFEDYLDSFWDKYKCDTLAISLAPFSDMNRPENIPNINPLIYWNFSPLLGYTYIINLNDSIDDIKRKYAQTTRNLINRLESCNDLTIYETSGEDKDFDILKQLNEQCYEHQDKSKRLTNEYLLGLWNLIKAKKYCRCFFMNQDVQTVGYIMLLYYKDCVYYFWGAGVHNSQNAQRYFMHSLIKQSKNEGYKWFEVGAANTWLRHGKDKTISDYKKSFSTTLHPIYKGIYIHK